MSLTGRIKKAAKAFNKDDEFSKRARLTPKQRQGANRMYREGCDKYRQRLQPAVNELKESIK